jgi:hypothetical protein
VQYKRQDALDVLHGAAGASAAAAAALPPRAQPSKSLLLLVAAIQLIVSLGTAVLWGVGRLRASQVELACMLVLPAALGALVLRLVLGDSDCYVCWPEVGVDLLPRPPPWARAEGWAAPAAKSQAAGRKKAR